MKKKNKKKKSKIKKRKKKKIIKKKQKKKLKTKSKILKKKRVTKKKRVIKKTKKSKKPLARLKSIKLPKFKFSKIKIIQTKKKKKFSFKKKLSELTENFLNYTLEPFFRAYDRYVEKRKIKKLKEEEARVKEEEKQKIERQKLIKLQKEKELKEKMQFAKETKIEMQIYLRQAERQARKEKAAQQKKILENLKISKQIEKFEARMNRETLSLEKYALQNLKESYEPILEKIQAIKDRYRKLQEEKLRTRIAELGIEVSADEDRLALLEKEKQFIFEKSKIENTLLPYTRSLRSMAFFINKKFIGRNMSPLKILDLSMEQGEVYVKWLDEAELEDFLILCYVKNNSLDSGKIVLELKTDPDKHSTIEMNFSEIFHFQDVVIDNTVAMLERIKNQKKAS